MRVGHGARVGHGLSVGRDFQASINIAAEVPGEPILVVSGLVGRALIEHYGREPELLRTMDPRKFEELVAELFDGFGYSVELTAQTRDGGYDVVAIRNREVRTRFLIECKRYSALRPIQVGPVRQLLGVKTLEGGSKVILATTSYFTGGAKAVEEQHPWDLELRDFEGIRGWISEYLNAGSVRNDTRPR